jgi:non-homologous end joining protein Ku
MVSQSAQILLQSHATDPYIKWMINLVKMKIWQKESAKKKYKRFKNSWVINLVNYNKKKMKKKKKRKKRKKVKKLNF